MPKPRRKRRRSRAPRHTPRLPPAHPPVWPGMVGGRYQPLSQNDMERIHRTALALLENVGMADATSSMIEIVSEAGGWLSENGRLHFPRSLIEDILARAPRRFVMPGQEPKHDMEVGGQRVHMGTGGAAPLILDFKSQHYRPTTTADLYDIARLVDTLDNIHFYWRSIVARDMPTSHDLDLNTAYACMQGTTKHIVVSFVDGKSLQTAVSMFDMRLGGEGEFRKRPFCSNTCTHVVPPLRFAKESCDALEAATRAGMPIFILSAAQAGATSPAALAGTIVQTIAETIAGLVFAFLIDPNCRVTLGTWPFVSDLRTGAMCSGSAEQALLAAGCAQMVNFYDLPCSVPAGMSDSKLPDAQAGAEKGFTLALAAQAGATMISESAGMHASLMGTAFESYVIDNDTLGAVQRTVRGIEVNDETLSYDVIREVVHGDGH
ncbi:MAG: methyltransferase, partial [Chloroflexi bacterium]|nr:methyltransferase [Chloroflexota bacterium]